jgi:hypothetical protein
MIKHTLVCAQSFVEVAIKQNSNGNDYDVDGTLTYIRCAIQALKEARDLIERESKVSA